MPVPSQPPITLADVQVRIESMKLSRLELKRLKTGINRICQMAGTSPADAAVNAGELRKIINSIHPAAHNIKHRTFDCYRSHLARALRLVGALDQYVGGRANDHPAWAPLLSAFDPVKRRTISPFMNWCAAKGIMPTDVSDRTLQEYLNWREHRTLVRRPRLGVPNLPRIWNDASKEIRGWPVQKLDPRAIRLPQRWRSWEQLSAQLQADAGVYLAARAKPDLFDPRPDTPKYPLSQSSLDECRRQIRVAASILLDHAEYDAPVSSLADLVRPEAFEIIIRRLHDKAGGKHSGLAACMVAMLQHVARFHLDAPREQLEQLRAVADKLPRRSPGLSHTDMALLGRFEAKRLRAKLLFLPGKLHSYVASELENGRVRVGTTHAAMAIEILLVAPMKLGDLRRLNWRRHFRKNEGRRGGLIIHIRATERVSGNRELIYWLPEDVAHRLCWYRDHLVPKCAAVGDGELFVSSKGRLKHHCVLGHQITKTMADYIGIPVTPIQFRHLAAMFYLERNPGDFETLRALLGFSETRTARRYGGLSRRMATRAYTDLVIKKRNELKLQTAGPEIQ